MTVIIHRSDVSSAGVARGPGPPGARRTTTDPGVYNRPAGRLDIERATDKAVAAATFRLLMSDGQKFMDTTSQLLSSGWTSAGMTT